ncbi:MAG TPA: NADH-quinone oxidoreductase subunit M [Solirubrobacterales bacterium]|nr:NADH-quinone oxidoreductase subunit M [Solirubrobacterales bacterium]
MLLSAILWVPVVFGLAGMAVPRRLVGWWAVLGAAVVVGLAVGLLAGFDSNAAGLQFAEEVDWIPGLGVSYSLGADGLNVFLVLLTAIVWTAGAAYAASRVHDRPRLFFAALMVAETATLGAFLAQDLFLFVLFFDLMLIPFYFLFGSWGTDPAATSAPGGAAGLRATTALRATTKMFIYTLVGSLLLLVGAIAAAVLAETPGGELTFSIRELTGAVAESDQRWLFWLFAAAFLVKMPAFLVHGWMPDAYRAAPLPALIVFSAVLSKVGAYGFLRNVLPILPDATVLYQEAMLAIAVVGILYGSVMAFTQTSMRLIAGYSSLAQLGFILAGIFALRPDGADGAVLQMVNHGIVVAPLLIIVGLLAERTGSDDLRRGGALAMRAPVFAALFLVVTMANLAIPGSANFIGEFYILNALFQAKIVFAFLAAAGIALAAYYALRLYQRTMHGRAPDDALPSRELRLRDGVVLVPLVACIVTLALYPQLVLQRTEVTATATVAAATDPDQADFPAPADLAGPEPARAEARP